MFTSYFGNVKSIPKKLVPVSIAVGTPRWFKGQREPRLAPTWAMLKMSAAEYDRRFAQILRQLDPQEIADELGENAVLLCWEKPGYRCHRRFVAEWLENKLKIVVPELGIERADTPKFTKSPPKPARK